MSASPWVALDAFQLAGLRLLVSRLDETGHTFVGCPACRLLAALDGPLPLPLPAPDPATDAVVSSRVLRRVAPDLPDRPSGYLLRSGAVAPRP